MYYISVYISYLEGEGMNGFEKRRMAKRNSIIEAAIDLFTKHGFKKVSVSEIAVKAKVSQVTIYNLFESKDKLKEVSVKVLFDRMFDAYEEILEGEESFMEKIESMFSLKMVALENQIVNIAGDLMNPNSSMANIMDECYHESVERFFKIIDMGKEEGCIRKDISNETIGVYFDMIKSYYYNPEKTSLIHDKKIMEEMYKVFWYGLVDTKTTENR